MGSVTKLQRLLQFVTLVAVDTFAASNCRCHLGSLSLEVRSCVLLNDGWEDKR